jgi:hypothetical protein
VIKPIVGKTFPLVETVNALRYLIEGRPFGRGRPHNLTQIRKGSKARGRPGCGVGAVLILYQ